MTFLNDVQDAVGGHSLILDVDQVRKGHVRLQTQFLYPDGSNVDVFVYLDPSGPLLPPGRLTDLGQTTAWLLDLQVRPWKSKKRQTYLEDAIRIYGVSQNDGAFELNLDQVNNDLVAGVVLLGQACVRVADLAYTKRSSMHASFTEDVEELVSDIEVPYEINCSLDGKAGRNVRVDYLVSGHKTSSAVLTWSSGSSSYAHTQANEIFCKWFDLAIPERTEQKVTIFDDRYNVYRDEDIERINEFAEVVAFSDRQLIHDLLAA